MAKRAGIGVGDQVVFAGSAFTLRLEVIDPNDDTKAIEIDGEVELIVKRHQEDSANIDAFDGTVTGTFNATRASNTQRALFELGSADTTGLIAALQAVLRRPQYVLWFAARLKDDPDTVYAYGQMIVNAM